MDNTDEPLNLTLKKMPIAIVAPFSIVDANQNIKMNNNNNNNNINNNNETSVSNINKNSDELPEDLSTKNKNNVSDQGLDLSKNSKDKNLENNVHNETIRNYLLKNDVSRNSYNKNTFNPDESFLNDYTKLCDFYENLTQKTYSTDNFYSFLNNLTDNKFLSMWYMNTILQQQNPFLNLTTPLTTTTYDTTKTSIPSDSNGILNNLLDKKPYKTYKFPSGFDALIKNEMQTEKIDTKQKPTKLNG